MVFFVSFQKNNLKDSFQIYKERFPYKKEDLFQN